MDSRKVEYVSTNAPFVTTEGQRYGKRPINLNQPIEYIAEETALYFGKQLLEYEFDEIDNSLLVRMTCGLRVRIKFHTLPDDCAGKKELDHDKETSHTQEHEHESRSRHAGSEEGKAGNQTG